MTDEEWFTANPTRQAHIRAPRKEPTVNKQRAVRYLDESELQFRSLGRHRLEQRRILIWKTPADHPTHPNILIKIPVIEELAEILEDSDQALIPYLAQLMEAQQP